MDYLYKYLRQIKSFLQKLLISFISGRNFCGYYKFKYPPVKVKYSRNNCANINNLENLVPARIYTSKVHNLIRQEGEPSKMLEMKVL